jgi:hypothetical protein
VVEGASNLTTSREGVGYLNRLSETPLASWKRDEVLVVGALYALFLSGRAVRFEEFNCLTLTSTRLLDRMRAIYTMYVEVGAESRLRFEDELFDVAREIRRMSASSVGKKWLRYRWISGITFFKTERVLPSMDSTEDPEAPRNEFAALYAELTNRPLPPDLDEIRMFSDMARAALYKSINNVPVRGHLGAATNWLELLIQEVVASAISATSSDYGMSSSLRDVQRLITPPRHRVHEEMLALTTKDFYTCFVGYDLRRRHGQEVADIVASSCQKRMMFNRWHFIAGNFDGSVPASRHWYYPPLVPDLAVNSDVRRQGHARAHVKYSIRVPGPDMSEPALAINGTDYRGFYDVRVVRMDGSPFEIEDMLRTRRRNMWMGAIFGVLTKYLEATPEDVHFAVEGFQVGQYLDFREPSERRSWAPMTAAI